jgi:hypothetical protein
VAFGARGARLGFTKQEVAKGDLSTGFEPHTGFPMRSMQPAAACIGHTRPTVPAARSSAEAIGTPRFSGRDPCDRLTYSCSEVQDRVQFCLCCFGKAAKPSLGIACYAPRSEFRVNFNFCGSSPQSLAANLCR